MPKWIGFYAKVVKPLLSDVIELFSSEERVNILMTLIGLGGRTSAHMLEKYTGFDYSTILENLKILEKTGFVEIKAIGKNIAVRIQKFIPPVVAFANFIEEVERITVQYILEKAETILERAKTKDEAQNFIDEFNDMCFRLRGIIEMHFLRRFWKAEENTRLLAEKFAIPLTSIPLIM